VLVFEHNLTSSVQVAERTGFFAVRKDYRKRVNTFIEESHIVSNEPGTITTELLTNALNLGHLSQPPRLLRVNRRSLNQKKSRFWAAFRTPQIPEELLDFFDRFTFLIGGVQDLVILNVML